MAGNWNFSTPGDPTRNWSVALTSDGVYDDNFFATKTNRQAGLRESEDVKVHANIPLGRLFIGAQYDYGFAYPHDINEGGYDQSHNASVSANYTVNPRLTLSLNDNFVSSLQPGVVQNPATGAPETISNFGDYIYNVVGGSVNFGVTPRWTASVSGSWDFWRFQNVDQNVNNHDDYVATVSALYAWDTRTTLGLNYQYSQTDYSQPGTNNGLNTYSDNIFLSAVHQFNPHLSLTIDGGYTLQESQDGSQSTSPSGSATLQYSYTDSTFSLMIAQSLSEASVGSSRSFSAQKNTSVALDFTHQFTRRLRSDLSATYVYSAFSAPLQGTSTTISPTEQSITAHAGLSYAFQPWMSVGMDYYYTQLITSGGLNGIPFIEPYNRDQITFGVTLTY